jgi:hypothetical protein
LRSQLNGFWLRAERRESKSVPADCYKRSSRAPDGTERKFTVQTREMPARRGQEVSLITTTHRRPRVLALANWTTIDGVFTDRRIGGVNYPRSEQPGLVQVSDLPWLAAGFVGIAAWLEDAGMVLFVPDAAVVLAVVAAVRWVARQRLTWRLDREIDLEAWRTAMGPAPLH